MSGNTTAERRRAKRNGLGDGLAQAVCGELLGLAVLTKALALGEGQWPGGWC